MKIPSHDEIRVQRDNYQLSQKECARALDISERQWRRYETGDSIMSGPVWIYFLNQKLWPDF